ncbi:hypothetical protein B9Z65_3620 [Elsinoe australis]|uniref:Uncharacterized protein n=1 Tax=Elsinoe australis TaxID=40998 RepID=A0A2P8AFQ6_9PEZI|nr:hypothetical protein B9Z65_3620 [Elsinoe australis]
MNAGEDLRSITRRLAIPGQVPLPPELEFELLTPPPPRRSWVEEAEEAPARSLSGHGSHWIGELAPLNTPIRSRPTSARDPMVPPPPPLITSVLLASLNGDIEIMEPDFDEGFVLSSVPSMVDSALSVSVHSDDVQLVRSRITINFLGPAQPVEVEESEEAGDQEGPEEPVELEEPEGAELVGGGPLGGRRLGTAGERRIGEWVAGVADRADLVPIDELSETGPAVDNASQEAEGQENVSAGLAGGSEVPASEAEDLEVRDEQLSRCRRSRRSPGSVWWKGRGLDRDPNKTPEK